MKRIILFLITIFFVACVDSGNNNPPLIEASKMFPFLKVGNIFTYQEDYPVECGTGYAPNILEISIDSIIITDSSTMYYGTYSYYDRIMDWFTDYTNSKIDTTVFTFFNNVLLFRVQDSVVEFVFADNLKIHYRCETGTIIDSIINFDQEIIYCKFDKIDDFNIYKQIDNYESEKILYKNCFISSNFISKEYQYWYASKWYECAYSSNNGLIYKSKGYAGFPPYEGRTLSLLEIKFGK